MPPNVKFYVDDFEQDWEFPEVGKFDYIHWRSLSGSTGNWDKLYGQALRNLKEGEGWIEVQEYDAWVYSDDDLEMKKAPWTLEWCETLNRVSTQFGKMLNVGRHHKRWMQEAGFVDVQEKVVKVCFSSSLCFLNCCHVSCSTTELTILAVPDRSLDPRPIPERTRTVRTLAYERIRRSSFYGSVHASSKLHARPSKGCLRASEDGVQ